MREYRPEGRSAACFSDRPAPRLILESDWRTSPGSDRILHYELGGGGAIDREIEDGVWAKWSGEQIYNNVGIIKS